MHTAYTTPDLALTARPASEIEADLLIIPAFEDGAFDDEPPVDGAARGEIAAARARGEFKGSLYDLMVVSLAGAGWKAARAVVIGAGKRADFTDDRLRRLAVVGGLAARQRRVARIAILCPAQPIASERAAQVVAEGVCLANFDGANYKTEQYERAWLSNVQVKVAGSGPGVEAALTRGRILGEASNEARVLANEPGNGLPPRVFADHAVRIGTAAGLQVEVLDERQIAEHRMGLLLGVAQGSQEPPRLVTLRHEPAQAIANVTLALVGKGITFDTGGISIKPAENMDKMKDDMSGGAAVIAAMSAIAQLQAPVRCIGVVPMTENMPGGRAVKPGDVLHSAEGKTVEIINTDAEGRLVLGDALWYARRLGATHLVDVATLTGACVVALGKTTTGLFGTPDPWVRHVHAATERAGDRAWPMPVFDDYKEQLKSEIADFTNTGGRAAGAITAALFIKEFTGGLPWVHMDIAGTAWAEESKAFQPKGPTGVAVRSLVELALAVEAWCKLE